MCVEATLHPRPRVPTAPLKRCFRSSFFFLPSCAAPTRVCIIFRFVDRILSLWIARMARAFAFTIALRRADLLRRTNCAHAMTLRLQIRSLGPIGASPLAGGTECEKKEGRGLGLC